MGYGMPYHKNISLEDFFAKFTRNWHVQWRYNGMGRVDKAQGAPERRGHDFQTRKLKKYK